jgi:hypothetical protein
VPIHNFQAKKEVASLVADDEWNGLATEMAELVKKAVMEDLRNNAHEFLGKDDYALGDISKEVNKCVKQGVADLRDKESYELGDLALVLDSMSKKYTEEHTGKPYQAGDLSKEN